MPNFLYFEGNLRVYLHIYSIQKHAGGYMASFLGRPYMNISSFTSVCPSVCDIFCPPQLHQFIRKKEKFFLSFSSLEKVEIIHAASTFWYLLVM